MDYPSISGIDIPYDQMGEYAAKLLLAMIENRESEFTYQEFKCRLIQRETTLDAVKILRLIKIKKRTPANSSL